MPTVFLSWSVLGGFLEVVKNNTYSDVMRRDDIDYWSMVFLQSPAIVMNAYDLFGCALSPRHVPDGVLLEENTQVLTFPRPTVEALGNPILWKLAEMFSYMLGDEDARSKVLQDALLHINEVIRFNDDLDACTSALSTCTLLKGE
jgi:hypothetical protein